MSAEWEQEREQYYKIILVIQLKDIERYPSQAKISDFTYRRECAIPLFDLNYYRLAKEPVLLMIYKQNFVLSVNWLVQIAATSSLI